MELESYTPLDEAIKRSSNLRPEARVVAVNLPHALGHYSAREIKSLVDFPRFDRSAMDGYALRSQETISSSRTNPSTFTIVGDILPSTEGKFSIGKGEAARITTGGKIPEGADSVAMLEDASVSGNLLSVYAPTRKYQNVSLRGEDLKKGFVIIRKGERIVPPHIAALMETGVEEVEILNLRVGILSTGDELISGNVINTTQPLLNGFFNWIGLEAVMHGAVKDDMEEIRRKIREMDEDVIIVTGGSGPGEFDLLHRLLEREGKIIFHGLRIRPGRTTGLAILGGRPVFILSGLPVAALISAENVILELLSRWYGISLNKRVIRKGRLKRSIVNTLGFRSFVRVRLEGNDDEPNVTPLRTTGSGVIYSMVSADGVVVVDENSEGIEEGNLVDVQMLRW
ncbi:MAG: molybdopterin molybdotransferase MoeA [Candidatus Thermoplasmatota archaeon]|jgi:molybdopterin molybdotransferase|nr:molybdopterin molybdotransferase MoeA [Candidatus Thermoplasmatota archaeon]